MENKKMISTAQKLDKFFKILQSITVGCLIAAVIVISILTIVNWVNPNAVIGTGYSNVSLGPISIEVSSEYAPDHSAILVYSWIMLVLISSRGIAIWFFLKYVRNILDPMKQGNPFHTDAVKNFKKLAWIVFAIGIIRNIMHFVATTTIIAQWHLSELSQIEGIQKVQVHVDLELGFLLIFFVLLLMSYIFEYGTSLQQLSDETL